MANRVIICGIDTSTLPKVSASEMLELLTKAKHGDKFARQECILNNMRLVLSIVQRFTLRQENVDDVFQVGVVGLIKAIDNFNIDLGVQFSTYAVPMIIGEIRRFQRDRTSIRVTRSLRDIAYKALKAKEQLQRLSDNEPTIDEIATVIEVPTFLVADAIRAISEPVSIYDNIYSENDDNLQILDQLKDGRNSEDSWIEKTILTDSISRLGNKEKEIVYKRYFVGKTQTEISSEIGISQAQVSRLEKEALSRIKKQLV